MTFNPFLMMAWYLVFVVSTTMHEAAHALVSWKLGDPTAFHGGQVTLNPRPHIRREPIGMVVVPLLSFMIAGHWMIGWASAPYDANWAWRHPRRSAWMALAGPTSNMLLMVLAFIGIRLGLAAGVFSAPEHLGFHRMVDGSGAFWSMLALLLSITMMLNLILMLFNLMPVPPLDGSGVLPLLMNDSTARRWMSLARNPRFAILGLVAAWLLFGHILRPAFAILLNLLHPGAYVSTQ